MNIIDDFEKSGVSALSYYEIEYYAEIAKKQFDELEKYNKQLEKNDNNKM